MSSLAYVIRAVAIFLPYSSNANVVVVLILVRFEGMSEHKLIVLFSPTFWLKCVEVNPIIEKTSCKV